MTSALSTRMVITSGEGIQVRHRTNHDFLTQVPSESVNRPQLLKTVELLATVELLLNHMAYDFSVNFETFRQSLG